MKARDLKIQYDATEESRRLMDSVLSGPEASAYAVQLSSYVRHGRPLGKSCVVIQRSPHNIWIDIYVSADLGLIFPLMFHFVRKGEPTELYLQRLREYIEQIEEQENSGQ